ncbi:hypothetical protein ZIOFF_020249 [Zingiber officinale]|uniref:Uncharacterized protein n=1 Tax=Zingiber officinale TaxID=94328 RepID=A0A8J5HHZ4_ZINOF|nr:hypothetical protein ZIOFF_020249 [Zingiber officinale]
MFFFFFAGGVEQQAGRCVRCGSTADLVETESVFKLFFVGPGRATAPSFRPTLFPSTTTTEALADAGSSSRTGQPSQPGWRRTVQRTRRGAAEERKLGHGAALELLWSVIGVGCGSLHSEGQQAPVTSKGTSTEEAAGNRLASLRWIVQEELLVFQRSRATESTRVAAHSAENKKRGGRGEEASLHSEGQQAPVTSKGTSTEEAAGNRLASLRWIVQEEVSAGSKKI